MSRKRMNRKTGKWMLILPLLMGGLVFSAFRFSGTGEKERVLMTVIMQGVRNSHYESREINDKFSEDMFKLFLDRLDHNKRFFIKSDISRFEPFRNLLDDQIQQGDYTFFNLTQEVMDQRALQAKEYYTEILGKPFDFSVKETIELDPEKTEWPANEIELKETWRKNLKYQVMTRVADALETQEKAKENNDTTVKIKSLDVLESEARERVLKTHDDWFHRLEKMERTDELANFLNALVNCFDPHTEYYPPQDKQDFDISMSGKLEGIGATLQERDGYIRIAAIVAGSPAQRQGQLEVGDLIYKVAQGAEEPVDVVDMRLDHAVKLIRGKKGTEVRLTVKKADGRMVVIPIIRDVVVLEETYAKSAILQTEGKNDKIGFIYLPKFYADFGNQGGPSRNCATDMENEITKLKLENISGLIIDLRNNGGGSLMDVVEIVGQFIDRGPVVQVKSRNQPPQVMEDRDSRIQYDGPLVILVNSISASASEIMAAAIQDYRRGIIMGSENSYGKGTVQRFFDLDNMVQGAGPGVKPLGSLKITMQKFYRINGGTTQLEGVHSDIAFQDAYSLMEIGEKEQEYPLKWDEITPARYTPWKLQPADIEKIVKKSHDRTAKNQAFSMVNENMERLKRNQDQTLYSLNLEQFRKDQKALDEEAKKYENIMKDEIKGLNVEVLASDRASHSSDTTWIARTDDWLKNLRKDIYLNEAVAVVRDIPR